MRLLPTDRYRDDAAFRTMVDQLRACIDRAEFTPSEIREAAMLAQILYEETRLRPMMIEALQDRPWGDSKS